MTVAPCPADATATELLARHTADDAFYFASPTGGLLASQAGAVLDVGGELTDIAGAVDTALAAHPADRVVVGAVGFDPATRVRLSVPEQVWRSGPLPTGLAIPAQRPGGGMRARRELPSCARYAAGVQAAVAEMAAGGLSKVVLARALEITTAAPVDTALLLRRLAARDPGGYLFAVDTGGGSTLVGSSPELLVSRRGAEVVANPLAGSTPRSADPVEDARRARALLTSEKDQREHAVVVAAVRGALGRLGVDLRPPAAPTLVSTTAMWHLGTTVRGRVADPSVSALRLAAALHPTPAVCGTPPERAREVIAAHESADRGFFAGLTGWQDAAGDGEWAVTLRCAQVRGDQVLLYAGAGVVPGSQPEAELAETEAKLGTVLNGLGL
ncbi:isochorismate synthase [Pilimelia columellifera]|uniref:isochorismate synthase n=1 Tax=Pilimelia columellifera subsp. columellifera TaxID=706583 RepID=A0ABP6AD29_9ACTN